MDHSNFVKWMMAQPQLFVLYSRFTRQPFVSCNPETMDDEAYFYTEEGLGREKEKELSSRGDMVTLEKKEKKDYLSVFSNLIMFGVNEVVIQTKEKEHRLELSEIVKAKDTSDMPEEKKPVLNPTLQLVMLYFLQEARKDVSLRVKGKAENLEEELAVNLFRSRYIVPFRMDDNSESNSRQVVIVKVSDGSLALPLFTDAFELQRFGKDTQFKVGITDFSKLETAALPENVAGYLINPAGCSFFLPFRLRDKLREKYVL